MTIQRDHYQHEADDALQMALFARTNEYRVSWLNVAQGWLRMIPQDQIQLALNDFDAAKRKNTKR